MWMFYILTEAQGCSIILFFISFVLYSCKSCNLSSTIIILTNLLIYTVTILSNLIELSQNEGSNCSSYMDVEESNQIFWFDLWVSSYCDAAHDHMIVHAVVPRCCSLIKLDMFHSNILVIWMFEQGVIIWLQYNNGLDLYGAIQGVQSALHWTHY